MKSYRIALVAACAALLSLVSATNAEEAKKEVTTVKCVVAGKEIKIDGAKTVSYKDATVYVCCNNCKAKMEEDSKQFAVKANHQLFLTGQAKQVKCPIAGRPINDEKTVKMAGVKVGFCCGNCQKKAASAEGDEQLKIAFSDAAFKKGFEINKKK